MTIYLIQNIFVYAKFSSHNFLINYDKISTEFNYETDILQLVLHKEESIHKYKFNLFYLNCNYTVNEFYL